MFLFDATFAAGLARIFECPRGLLGCVAFIDPVDWQFEALEFYDEIPDRGLEVAGAVVNVQRHADNQSIRAPLLEQRCDAVEIRPVFAVANDAERARRTGYVLANGNADSEHVRTHTVCYYADGTELRYFGAVAEPLFLDWITKSKLLDAVDHDIVANRNSLLNGVVHARCRVVPNSVGYGLGHSRKSLK